LRGGPVTKRSAYICTGCLLTDSASLSPTYAWKTHSPEVRGFVDALVGRTVVEIKRDLRRESHDAEEQLTRYLEDREAQTGERFLGLATDGATFAPY
jgi:hypothetical protein